MNPLHDDDGNVTDYKNMKYSWNAENQMVSAEPENPVEGDKKTEYLYDYMGRRAGKQIFSRNADNSGWNAAPDTEKLFVYDGWNLIKEITKTGATSSDKFYVWGPDLSQSLQGAGGIGGLVCAVHAGEVRHYFYDANGNVGQVVNETGSIVARYEYDPFGNAIVADGAYAQENPFRFSTKYFDAETGLYYYGYRYYSPELGRWWSRDPVEEQGGLNLYQFCLNNMMNQYDVNGLLTLSEFKDWVKKYVTRTRVLSFFGGVAQVWAGVSYIGLGVGSIVGTGGLSTPLSIGAIGAGGLLFVQGINNILAAVDDGEVNAARSMMEDASVKYGYSSRTGTMLYYGLEIFTGVLSIGTGIEECGRIIFYGKTVGKAKAIRMIEPTIGPGLQFVYTEIKYSTILRYGKIGRGWTGVRTGHDFYQLKLAYDEEKNVLDIRERIRQAEEAEWELLEEETMGEMEKLDWRSIEQGLQGDLFQQK